MADGFSIEIIEHPLGSLGLFSEGTMAAQVIEIIARSMDKVGAHIAERAQANAPFGTPFKEGGRSPDPGALRRSIRHEVKRSGLFIDASVLVGVSYGLRMHEELTPAGPLQLGKRSRQQPGTPEGGVGGKFIERVVNFHAKTYQNYLRDMSRANLPNAVSRKVSVKRITEGSS